MDGALQLETRSSPRARPRGGDLFGRGLLQMLGLAASACAVVVGAALAFVFAASLVVIAVMTSALIAFAGFAWRAQRTVRAPARSGPQHLEARRVGHSWVAYGWDRG
jgi:hypothetical protein